MHLHVYNVDVSQRHMRSSYHENFGHLGYGVACIGRRFSLIFAVLVEYFIPFRHLWDSV